MAEDGGNRIETAPEPLDVEGICDRISNDNLRIAHAAVQDARYACRVFHDTGQRDQIIRVLGKLNASERHWEGAPPDMLEEAGRLRLSCREYLHKLGTLPELLADLDSAELHVRDWAFDEICKRAYKGTNQVDLPSIQSKLETTSLQVSNCGALNAVSLAGLKAFCRQQLGPYGKEDKKPNPMKNPPSGQPSAPPPKKAVG